MISEKLAIGYYGVPFNLVIVVTDLITIMVEKEHDLLAKAFIVVLTVFRYMSQFIHDRLLNYFPLRALKIWLWSTLMS